MGVILRRPFQKKSVSTPTIMGDVRDGEVDAAFIQVVEQCQKVTLGILIPKFIVFAKSNQIGRVEIYKIIRLIIYVAKELSIVLIIPFYLFLA